MSLKGRRASNRHSELALWKLEYMSYLPDGTKLPKNYLYSNGEIHTVTDSYWFLEPVWLWEE